MTDTPWFMGPMTAFDLETTGTDVETEHVVTAAVISLNGSAKPFARTWLAAVEIDIPEGAEKVHGISTAEARKNGRPATKVLDEIADLLSVSLREATPIVGHNVVYDLTLLDRELRRKGLPTLTERSNRQGPVICTRVLDQHVVQRRRKPPLREGQTEQDGARTLRTTAGVYGLGWDDEAAHGAEYDAMQAARIAYRIGQIAHTAPGSRPLWVQRHSYAFFDDVADIDMVELFVRQQQWAAEQAASLEEWLRQSKPDAVVKREWPLIPFGGES
jgi:DNA polymerase-3 subunit epsilon